MSVISPEQQETTPPTPSSNPMFDVIGNIVSLCFDPKVLADPADYVSNCSVELGAIELQNGETQHTYIRKFNSIADSVIISAGVSVGNYVEIDECSTIGPGATIDHGVVIGQHVVVDQEAKILLGAHLGDGTYIGQGAEVSYDKFVEARTKVLPHSILY